MWVRTLLPITRYQLRRDDLADVARADVITRHFATRQDLPVNGTVVLFGNIPVTGLSRRNHRTGCRKPPDSFRIARDPST